MLLPKSTRLPVGSAPMSGPTSSSKLIKGGLVVLDSRRAAGPPLVDTIAAAIMDRVGTMNVDAGIRRSGGGDGAL